jgi:hypothetical protein
VEAGRDAESELRRLRYEVAEIRGQLRALFAALASLPVVLLVALSLFGSAYREVDENEEEIEDAGTLSLVDLPGQASDLDNGAVQVVAILTILAAIALAIAAVVLLGTRRTRPALAAAAALGLTWLVLQLLVGASGGDGAVGDLGADAGAGAWWPLAAAAWAVAGCWWMGRTR